jgi:hypothetical protein
VVVGQPVEPSCNRLFLVQESIIPATGTNTFYVFDPVGEISPVHKRISSAWRVTPVLRKMCSRWVFAVGLVMLSVAAVSVNVRPPNKLASTLVSAGVRQRWRRRRHPARLAARWRHFSSAIMLLRNLSEDGAKKMNADPKWTRRQALGMLGAGAAVAALPHVVSAEPSFPDGAVIRTVLKDYPPGELGGGATHFHEHMSQAPGFLARFRQYANDAAAVNRHPNTPPPPAPTTQPLDLSFMQDLDLMTDELAIAKREGIACIVDAGHPDMGRDVGALRQLSLRSGLPIVVGGGFYAQPFYAREISRSSRRSLPRRRPIPLGRSARSDRGTTLRRMSAGCSRLSAARKTLTVFVPKVKKAGASDEVLRGIMNDNPRRFLAFVPKIKRKV